MTSGAKMNSKSVECDLWVLAGKLEENSEEISSVALLNPARYYILSVNLTDSIATLSTFYPTVHCTLSAYPTVHWVHMLGQPAKVQILSLEIVMQFSVWRLGWLLVIIPKQKATWDTQSMSQVSQKKTDWKFSPGLESIQPSCRAPEKL